MAVVKRSMDDRGKLRDMIEKQPRSVVQNAAPRRMGGQVFVPDFEAIRPLQIGSVSLGHLGES